MKFTITTLEFFTLFLVAYVDDSVLLTLPETQITHKSNSPSWIKLTGIEGLSVANRFSVTNNYDIELYQEAI